LLTSQSEQETRNWNEKRPVTNVVVCALVRKLIRWCVGDGSEILEKEETLWLIWVTEENPVSWFFP